MHEDAEKRADEIEQENMNETAVSEDQPQGGNGDESSRAAVTEPQLIEALEKQLEDKEGQIHEYIARLQRLQADFENYRKRQAREQEALTRLIENRVFLKVLPIFDSFERAIQTFDQNGNKEALAEGVRYIHSQFIELLKGEGIEPLDVVGKAFDPARHEALFMVESDEQPNMVLEEFERGYQRSGQMLRPSRVKVSKKRAPEEKRTGADENAATEGATNERGDH